MTPDVILKLPAIRPVCGLLWSAIRSPMLAQAETQSFQATELDLPESTGGILLILTLVAVLFGIVFRTSLRDSRFLKLPYRLLLLVPRVIVLVLVLCILLNPRQRTQLTRIEKSQVGILIDSSLSMAYPEGDGQQASGGRSRTDAVSQELLISGLLKKLAEAHQISLYRFDTALVGPVAFINGDEVRIPTTDDSGSAVDAVASGDPESAGSAGSGGSTAADIRPLSLANPATLEELDNVIRPVGTETRLGESLNQLIGQMSSRTLSGLVLISDGRLNAGLSADPAKARAERSGTRLITVGVGSQKPQLNWWIAGVQSPADVHKGDPFDINVSVQGSGLSDSKAVVRLYQQTAGSDGRDRKLVAEQSVQVTDERLPSSVRFSQQLPIPGRFEYVARIEPADAATIEMTTDDNERRREIEVTDRRIRVLLISSGPMRDYQFVRNTLYRHSGVESDVWLQTVAAEDLEFVSQEARTLLTRFPATEAELFRYDVIVAFDPDWSRLSAEERQYLNRWVSEHSGGLIVVAGEIFTPRLAQEMDAYRDIAVLYPVVLNRMVPELQITQRSDQPWPLTLTPEGRSTEFLKIADATGTASLDLWQSFKGIFRSYPVRSLRDGAVTLLEYGNPRARTEIGQPPFLASQFYGSGRTLFIGSAETWRMRELSPQGHQRFWTSLIREAGQGRRNRGTARGLLLLDRSEAVPGQTINIRAQLYDSRLQPLQAESVAVSIVDGEGRPVSVPDRLTADGRGVGQYVSNFRAARAGVYRISVPVPESGDVLQETVDVVLPNLESQNPTRNVSLLEGLTQDTDGRYLDLSRMAAELPALLPDRSEPVIVDEQLRTLWDRAWMLYLIVGLLGFEWALRRLMRLS